MWTRWIVIASLSALGMFPTAAQVPNTAAGSAELQSCFMGTPDSFWAGLKLTSDQVERMSRVREACRTECVLPKGKAADDHGTVASGDMIITELRNILTMDQYAAWTTYCKGLGESAPTGH
jgi:hypothetical protein